MMIVTVMVGEIPTETWYSRQLRGRHTDGSHGGSTSYGYGPQTVVSLHACCPGIVHGHQFDYPLPWHIPQPVLSVCMSLIRTPYPGICHNHCCQSDYLCPGICHNHLSVWLSSSWDMPQSLVSLLVWLSSSWHMPQSLLSVWLSLALAYAKTIVVSLAIFVLAYTTITVVSLAIFILAYATITVVSLAIICPGICQNHCCQSGYLHPGIYHNHCCQSGYLHPGICHNYCCQSSYLCPGTCHTHLSVWLSLSWHMPQSLSFSLTVLCSTICYHHHCNLYAC